MEAADGGGDAKSTAATTTFRWIDAARYVLALAVTVLIVMVIAHAIKVVLREKELIFTVARGSVSVGSIKSEGGQAQLSFNLTIQAFNPSGSGVVYYTTVSAFLAGKSGTSLPKDYFLGFSSIPDMAVMPQSMLFTDTNAVGGIADGIFSEPSLRPYFNMFYYNGSIMRDAVLRLNGTLVTEVYSGFNTTARTAVYCCAPLTVGDDDSIDLQDTPADVPCTEQQIVVGTETASSLLSCN